MHVEIDGDSLTLILSLQGLGVVVEAPTGSATFLGRIDSILKSRKVSLKGSLYGDIYWPAQLKMSGVGVALGEISRVCSIEEPWEIALSAAHPNLVSLDM